MAFLTEDLKIKDCEPFGYFVIVELHKMYKDDGDGYHKTTGGIVLAKEVAKKEQQAVDIVKVLKIGEFAHKNHACGADGHKSWGYDVGDMVRINAHAGKKISNDPEDLRRIVCDHDIICGVTLEEGS